MQIKDYMRKYGFHESIELLGRVVGFSPDYLRILYKKEQIRFNKLLIIGKVKICSIYHIKTRNKLKGCEIIEDYECIGNCKNFKKCCEIIEELRNK